MPWFFQSCDRSTQAPSRGPDLPEATADALRRVLEAVAPPADAQSRAGSITSDEALEHLRREFQALDADDRQEDRLAVTLLEEEGDLGVAAPWRLVFQALLEGLERRNKAPVEHGERIEIAGP